MSSIIDIINFGESQTVEFKTSFQKELITSVVAFANTRGGKILVGVSDDGTIILMTVMIFRISRKKILITLLKKSSQTWEKRLMMTRLWF